MQTPKKIRAAWNDSSTNLSRKRALAVRTALLNLGVNPERIQLLWFGWEPPQISEPVAAAYGIGDVYVLGGEGSVNQSVMVVVY